MSEARQRTVTIWPQSVALHEQFAKQARAVAAQRQSETGWTDEETVARVQATAALAAERIAEALLASAEMALDVWKVTK